MSIEISERIENFTSLCPNVKEALACLASDVIRISEVAKLLGVSTRTLQRLLKSQTGRTPAAWLSLARVRKTARIIGGSVNLAQSAIMCGYSDQAHMNREFKRWLNITPAKINSHPEILRQLDNLAYN
ncbi:MAG: helix-turn-helix transcriptional regulator [Devosiaceae bacterium]|nr:helix-turn-helix transcriptional regulator [Devosiaceae bacterium]